MAHLQANLDSLIDLDYPNDKLEILLVDNGSTDGSTAWVSERFPQVRIVKNEQNLGFAAGNNAGAVAAFGEWIAFLNPDIRVRPDWLKELVRPLRDDPSVASVASKMLNWDGTAVDFADAAINFMSWGNQPGFGELDLEQNDTPRPLLFACGGAMLVRRDLFLEAGGFDPDFFAFFEDVDLGWRLWLLGYKVVFAPRAVVYHRHHGSWQAVNDAKRWVLSERNALFTVCKNYDDDNLNRILPAVLLLVLQRASLDVKADPTHFGLPQLPRVTAWHYYLHETLKLLRAGRFREFGQRVIAELGRRVSRDNTPPPVELPRAWQLPDEKSQFQVPAIALSRLLAGRDVLERWSALMEKRGVLQARRQRCDQEIFPLFQWALVSNFGNAEFILAMNQVISKFDLLSLFKYERELPIDSTVHALSQAVSLRLLNLMDRAFSLSGVPETTFRLGEEKPQPNYSIPAEAVSLLVYANHWLWKLPDGDLATVLRYLQHEMDTYSLKYGG